MTAPTEERFVQYCLDKGLCAEDEVDEARRLCAEAKQAGESLTLPEALFRSRAITRNQGIRAMNALKEGTGSPRVQVPGVQLMERIGRGSQAIVYKGRQVSVDRIVAVKVLLSQGARDAESRRRFIQEAKSAAQLSHNNIVQAIDAGESEGYPWFIMEYVDGKHVGELMKERGGKLTEDEALRIIIQIAEALAHAHSRGFIHRDVKPKNIMLTSDGVAKLADMGLARQATDVATALDEAGKAYGTPYYIAPEQVRGDPRIDFRADIYSLGATLYEMLTGQPPFPAPTPQQVMQKHVTTQLTPPDHVNPELSAGVSEVVEVMMGKRPADRYASTEDLLVDLRSVAAGEPPRIARERVGAATAMIEGLADGEDLADAAEEPVAAPGPFAFNQLSLFLLVALVVAILVIVLQLVMGD